VLTGLDLQHRGSSPRAHLQRSRLVSASSTQQVIALHIHDKEDHQLAIFILAPSGSTAGPHRTHLQRQRTGVACDQACSGHVGVVSRDQRSSPSGWPCLTVVSE